MEEKVRLTEKGASLKPALNYNHTLYTYITYMYTFL